MWKRCLICSCVWVSAIDIVLDEDMKFIGCQEDENGNPCVLLFFNHSCGTTLSLNTEEFERDEDIKKIWRLINCISKGRNNEV